MKLLSSFKKLSLFRKVVVIIVVLLIGWFVFSRIANTNKQPQYETAQVERGTLVSSLAESGQVVSSNRVAITTEASGVINNVYVKDGDTVTVGEKIADMTLDTQGAQRQAQAWSQYLSAQNTLNAAKAKMNSLQSALFKANQAFVTDRGVANPSDQQKADPKYIEENADWLQAEADYNNQAGVIAAAESSLNSAWLSYQTTSPIIVALQSGTITDIVITPGLQIKISTSGTGGATTVSSQPIASIRTEGNPIVSVNLSEVDVTKIKIGQKATVTFDALPNQTFTGKITGIDTTGLVSSGVTSYPATIVLDTESEKILPNMSASANVITEVKDNVLLLPTAAVQTTGNQSTVRVLKNGKIQSVNVKLGASSDTQTEIVSGLNEGDTVVIGSIPAQGQAQTNGTSSPFRINPFGGGLGGGTRGAGGLRPGGGGGR